MPVIVDAPDGDAIDLAEFKEGCRDLRMDASEADGLLAAAPLLRRLQKNRRFLAQFLFDHLDRFRSDARGTEHTGQIFPLGPIDDNHYGRACIWPSADSDMYRKTGPALFYSDEPHDPNFSFLTVGYSGPGYSSDYYEVRDDTGDWHPGTKVQLTPTGRKTLAEGAMFLYRKAVDVHSQIPPAATSISLNIVAAKKSNTHDQQHIFTRDMSSVAYIHHQRANYPLFAAAANLDVGNSFERLADLSESHRDGFIRFYALKALAASRAERADVANVMETASKDPNPVLRGLASRYLEMMAA